MTKCAAIASDGSEDCPRWRQFLDRVTGGNRQLEAYLKRCAGYWLTGLTGEHAMWFLYGTGRNGKGVFLNTISRIMGDYAMTASPDTFTADGHGKHLTVLARLQGARLVVSQETEEGVPWAEARIKSVTGQATPSPPTSCDRTHSHTCRSSSCSHRGQSQAKFALRG